VFLNTGTTRPGRERGEGSGERRGDRRVPGDGGNNEMCKKGRVEMLYIRIVLLTCRGCHCNRDVHIVAVHDLVSRLVDDTVHCWEFHQGSR
jgi:hypothetical protein